MSVETVDECLNGRLVEVTQVRSTLSRLLAQHEGLWVDQSESVNDDLALDRLYRIDDHGNGSRSELFEGLLGVDID